MDIFEKDLSGAMVSPEEPGWKIQCKLPPKTKAILPP